MSNMKEIPILFSTEMVRAILEGRKTMTRRMVKPQPKESSPESRWDEFAQITNMKCRYGKPGDLLWVRESFLREWDHFFYKADDTDGVIIQPKWKPSIHVPKAACRIWLQVEEVRVERLHDLTEEDARAEGIEYDWIEGQQFKNYHPVSLKCELSNPIESFQTLWTEINHDPKKPDAYWQCNPWVWVIKFKVLSTTGRPVPADQEAANHG